MFQSKNEKVHGPYTLRLPFISHYYRICREFISPSWDLASLRFTQFQLESKRKSANRVKNIRDAYDFSILALIIRKITIMTSISGTANSVNL
jgi:hypothetical protein